MEKLSTVDPLMDFINRNDWNLTVSILWPPILSSRTGSYIQGGNYTNDGQTKRRHLSVR